MSLPNLSIRNKLIASFALMALGGGSHRLAGSMTYVALNLFATLIFLLSAGLVYGASGSVRLGEIRQSLAADDGDVLVVLEAMKMENPVKAHKAGAVTGLAVEVGGQVNKGAVLMELK